jgi:hypothetical protein
MKIRKGYVAHCHTDWGDNAKSIINYQDTTLFAYMWAAIGDNRIYDVTDSNPASPAPVNLTGSSASEIWKSKFAGKAVFTTITDVGTSDHEYDGSSWGTFGFGLESTATLTYKGRVYMAYNGIVKYGGLGAVTGSTTSWQITELFEDGDTIFFMKTLSSPANVPTEQYFVIGNGNGEILVYAGDYPDAPNWEVIAKFRTPEMLGYDCAVEVNGDIYLVTEIGLVSLQKLFQNNGDIQENVLVSNAITPYWTSLISTVALNEGRDVAEPSIAYWPDQNNVYILINGFVDQEGTYEMRGAAATMLVYNIVSGGWGIQKLDTAVDSTYGVAKLTYFKNSIYFTAGQVIMTQSGSVYKDEDPNDLGTYTAYDIELDSAYTNLGTFNKHKNLKGIEAVINTDFDGSKVGVLTAADFGRKVSGATKPTLQDGRQIIKYNSGIRGAYLQYRLRGISDVASEDGFELYGVGMVAE